MLSVSIPPDAAGSSEVTDILSANPEKGNHFRNRLYYNQRTADNHFSSYKEFPKPACQQTGMKNFNIDLYCDRTPARVKLRVHIEKKNAASVENAAFFIGGEAGIRIFNFGFFMFFECRFIRKIKASGRKITNAFYNFDPLRKCKGSF